MDSIFGASKVDWPRLAVAIGLSDCRAVLTWPPVNKDMVQSALLGTIPVLCCRDERKSVHWMLKPWNVCCHRRGPWSDCLPLQFSSLLEVGLHTVFGNSLPAGCMYSNHAAQGHSFSSRAEDHGTVLSCPTRVI